MSAKFVRDLQPGDRVPLLGGYGDGVVTKLLPTKTEIKSMAGKYGDALIVCFDIQSGKGRGTSDYDFAHPDDRVRLS